MFYQYQNFVILDASLPYKLFARKYTKYLFFHFSSYSQLHNISIFIFSFIIVLFIIFIGFSCICCLLSFVYVQYKTSDTHFFLKRETHIKIKEKLSELRKERFSLLVETFFIKIF